MTLWSRLASLSGVATGLCRNKQHVRKVVSKRGRWCKVFRSHPVWTGTAPDGVGVDSGPGARAAVVMLVLCVERVGV
jgi:hypothetical protein